MNTFIIVQIFGIITLIISVISMQQRKKENLLILGIIAAVFFVLQYLLTDQITGAIAFMIGIIRGIVFFYYKKKNKKPSVPVLIFFITCMIISSIVSWKNIFSIFPVIVSTTNTWGVWQDNMKYTRRTALFAQIGWFIYDLIGGMYTGALTEMCNIISTIIAIWRFDRKT